MSLEAEPTAAQKMLPGSFKAGVISLVKRLGIRHDDIDWRVYLGGGNGPAEWDVTGTFVTCSGARVGLALEMADWRASNAGVGAAVVSLAESVTASLKYRPDPSLAGRIVARLAERFSRPEMLPSVNFAEAGEVAVAAVL